MEVTDGETEACVDLEPTIRSDHYNSRGFKGVVPWKYKLSMVITTWKV